MELWLIRGGANTPVGFGGAGGGQSMQARMSKVQCFRGEVRLEARIIAAYTSQD